jgi:hypothetical protein
MARPESPNYSHRQLWVESRHANRRIGTPTVKILRPGTGKADLPSYGIQLILTVDRALRTRAPAASSSESQSKSSGSAKAS